MLHNLKLLLPALIPSWRFFDWIAPSPRIEFTLRKSPRGTHDGWREFRPRPTYISLGDMLKRLFWNPSWNESLFLMSCAERLMQHPTEHSRQEILKRIAAELSDNAPPYLQFRLIFLSRNGHKIQRQRMYLSPIYHYRKGADK